MDKKITGIVAYITWIGLIIAYFAGDKEGAKFHINQALVIWVSYLASILVGAVLGGIPFVGGIIGFILGIFNIFLFVCFILGLIYACKEEEKEIPLIGQIKILK
uniref:hypothetical protein n=1 Tax=Acetatifactor sp. TaxID=1872090 RepID=UPI004056097F